LAPLFPSDYAHLTLGSLTVKDLSVRKRFPNVSNLYPFLLPLLMCMVGEEKLTLLCLFTNKIERDSDTVPFRLL